MFDLIKFYLIMPSLGKYSFIKWLTQALKPLLFHLYGQFRLLKYHFDPVQHETPLPSNRHFLLPMTLIIIAQLYGIYGLDPNFKWSDIIDRSFYNSNPYIHYHQIVPRRSWRILQFLYFVTNASNIAILGCLALSSSTQINQKYRITLIDDDEKGEDHDADSAEIVRFQKKAKKVLLFNSVFYYLYYLIFTNRNVYLNGAFYWGFCHGLFWFLVIPIWTVYYIFSKKVCFRFFKN